MSYNTYSRYQQPNQGDNALDLNTLLNKDYTNSLTYTKIPAMLLVEKYKPTSNEEMREVISNHAPWQIQDCVNHAFTAQTQYNCHYTYAQIHEFIDTTMVQKTMEGAIKEKQCLEWLQHEFKDYKFERANYKQDLEYAVDILVKDATDTIVAAVQVKSNSHRVGKWPATVKAREECKRRNDEFSAIYQAPVFYIYYWMDMKFMEPELLVTQLREVLADTYAH